MQKPEALNSQAFAEGFEFLSGICHAGFVWSRRNILLGASAVAVFLLLTIRFLLPTRRAEQKLPAGAITPVISVGATHGLVLAGDGSLWSWGSDFLGWPVLGLGNITNQAALRRIDNETNWIGINAGQSHNLAVRSDGTLWGWGQNIYGEIGNGTRMSASYNRPVRAAAGHDWVQAVAGGSHSIALKKDGTLWAWGNNWAGQLGIGATNDSLVPVQIGSATNWVKVWAGMLGGAALRSDGSLWIWGDNPALTNQLSRSDKNLLAPTRFSTDTNWVDAAFGNQVFLAIKSDGTIWAWGRYAHNYTGNNAPADVPSRIGPDSDWQFCWTAEEARELYAVLRKKDGSMWVMESSPATGGALRFTKINLPKHLVALGAGGGGGHGAIFMHDGVCTSIGLTSDGEVWAWGRGLGWLGYTRSRPYLQSLAKLLRRVGLNVHWGDPEPIECDTPWQISLEAGVRGMK